MCAESNTGPNPSGLCMCGCGGITTVATENDPKNGIRKGEHRRYLRAHHHRGVPRTEDVRRRISEANAGKNTGPDNPRWKGGLQMRKGRLNRLVGVDHPMAPASGYVLEYRLVMAEKLGRYLSSDEHVHHIDLDASNNDPDNLVVLTAAQHMRLHRLINRGGMKPQEALDQVLGGRD
jgi:hypothetical protein